MPLPLLESGDQQYVRDADHSEVHDRISELESRLTDLEIKLSTTKRDAVVMLLGLLTESLRYVASGKMEMPNVSPSSDGQSSKWDAVKARLQPRQQLVIEVLLLQGNMTRRQIAAALKMNYTNCANNVISPLMRAGWIIDSGNGVCLKTI